ncbi:cysteine-rich receptor-like protein kinase 10 [Tanacetum coccineum]|uniref:Cysteine-rich receptor-like protein kinase 10 n=1 Tax=Tanacetum coccineum TaxID=301880 RepID=A0ABQ5HC96_9ASTR
MGGCYSAKPTDKENEEAADDFVNPYTHIPSKSYPIQLVKQATDNFSEVHCVGEGACGKVYECMIERVHVAVKRSTSPTSGQIVAFENEIKYLSQMDHVNVIRLLGYAISRDDYILIYEYMSKNSLSTLLSDQRETLDWSSRVDIIKGIANGLNYLHNVATVNLIHRDIKPQNILLDDTMVPKIADFGTVRDVMDNSPADALGTFGYLDPTYLASGRLSSKVDVYSFGVIILEMLTGMKAVDKDKDYLHIAKAVWTKFTGGESMALADHSLLNMVGQDEFQRMLTIGLLCVQETVNKRPSSEELVLMLENSSITLAQPSWPPV